MIRNRAQIICLALALLVTACGTTNQAEPSLPATPLRKPAKLPIPATNASAEVDEGQLLAEIDENISIFFTLGLNTINARSKEKLRAVAQRLKSDESATITLAAYANDNGSSSFNLAVADSRANAASAYLKKLGVKPMQIRKNVVGGEKTSSNCRSSECRRMMRRVELIVSSSKSSVE